MNSSAPRLASGLALACVSLGLSGCSSEPPLRVHEMGTSVRVDVQTLGEYQTTICRIRLTVHGEQRTIWEVAAQSGTPQIHGLTLVPGANSAALRDVQGGQYKIVTPTAGDSFVLDPGGEYTIEVWGCNGEGSRAATTFRLPGPIDH